MNLFPDTTTGSAKDRHASGPVLAAVCCGLLLVAAAVSLWPGDFSPGEEVISAGAEDIAVSREDAAYPTSDTLRFDGRPEVLYVYLRVEGFAPDGDFGARVDRRTRTSVLGRLLGGDGLRVVQGGAEPLGASGGGVSGVLKFAVRPRSGSHLPAGDYTVEVYNAAGGAERGNPVARKYFVVGG
ncbi:hypothetical protein AVDCRST_MAG82-1377 [uncultured Rubrobacteraceae bacterium]|uniref:Uncharacterized protein n=1 Tax=uncultured Rubrobacteraceae bacterium TaxID=349277 RepID=A0A6J4PS81_9ACTN|nr:hypothetical protein AVDCRST_MAG82-1377 [uncultured Rubrobacteraceae bacterium]